MAGCQKFKDHIVACISGRCCSKESLARLNNCDCVACSNINDIYQIVLQIQNSIQEVKISVDSQHFQMFVDLILDKAIELFSRAGKTEMPDGSG